MTNVPIIFIHYGDNDYLKYVLQSAKTSNNRVILIGDKSNSKYKRIGIEHHNFDDFLFGEKLEQFNRVYKRIGGEAFEKMNFSKGGKDWTKFNFQKWFVLKNFCLKYGINTFWTFDSDTLIFDELDKYENVFANLDYSVMNANNQLQGKVNTLTILDEVINLSIEKFEDTPYLNTLKEEFQEHPEWGFTLMRVFDLINDQKTFSVARLKDISSDITFDECICHELDMQTSFVEEIQKEIKDVYYDGKYLYEKTRDAQLRRLVTINMSWVPDSYFQVLFDLAKSNVKTRVRKVDFDFNLTRKIRFYASKLFWRIK